MRELKKNVAKLYDLDGDWDEMIFTLHNPTNSDTLFNLFDPLITQQYNVPNTPTGYVQPPVNVGTGSGSPAPPPYPAVAYYPNINFTDTYPVNAVNNTMAYDSVHSRMYMTYFGAGGWFLTWTPFTASSVFIAGGVTVVDTAISTTSNKIYIIDNNGGVYIFSTVTNTLVTSFLLPAAVYRRIEWNSVKNTFYITANNDTVIEIDAVTDTVVATILTPLASSPFGITYKASTNEIFVTYSLSNQIAKINCVTNTISTLFASVTATPDAIFYNSLTNLVTYGSSANAGVRTFDATTLIFSSSIIANQILDIGLYDIDNKLYLMNAVANNIIVVDGNTLSVSETITTASTFGARAEIKTFPSTDEMLYNYSVSFIPPVTMEVGRLARTATIFWIDGSAGYNFTVRDFFNSPAWVRRIYIYSKTEENFKQVINHIYKDANGIECQIPLIPSISVGINQFQGWIAQLDFPNHEAIFGINQWFQNVFIKKHSELTMLLIYKQIEKSKLLANIGVPTVFDDKNIMPNKLRKWSERDLKLYDTATITPYKQNMYLGRVQDAVRPFDFSILKTYQNEPVQK